MDYSIIINEIIYIFLKNINIIKHKNLILEDLYLKNMLTQYEKYIFKNKSLIIIIHILKKHSINMPFTKNYIILCFIYMIFIDNLNYINKLIIMGNIKEIFYFIKGTFYRNLYGYYNIHEDLEIYNLEQFKKNKNIIINTKKEKIEKINKYPLINKIFLLNNLNNKIKNNYIKEKEYVNTTQQINTIFLSNIK